MTKLGFFWRGGGGSKSFLHIPTRVVVNIGFLLSQIDSHIWNSKVMLYSRCWRVTSTPVERSRRTLSVQVLRSHQRSRYYPRLYQSCWPSPAWCRRYRHTCVTTRCWTWPATSHCTAPCWSYSGGSQSAPPSCPSYSPWTRIAAPTRRRPWVSCWTRWEGVLTPTPVDSSKWSISMIQDTVQGKFRPCFIFALFALWPEGQFKTGLIELFVKDYVRKF